MNNTPVLTMALIKMQNAFKYGNTDGKTEMPTLEL